MTPLSELDRLFPAIPKPDPLGDESIFDDLAAEMISVLPLPGTLSTIYRVHLRDGIPVVEAVPESEWSLPLITAPMSLGDEVDADETNHGPCAQGDCSDE